MAERSDFRLLDRQRVRWAEVDMQRIVFNGHYLMYFDTAVAAYWRAMAMPYHEAVERLGGDLVVRKAGVEYEASARYDDVIETGVRTGRIGNSSLVLHLATFRGRERLVHGELVYVWIDPATQTSRPVPEALRALLRDFDAGAPVVELRLGDWQALQAEAFAVRRAVFVDEQRIPLELECDAFDPGALHAVAVNHLGMPVATGRLLAQAPGVARIGRMAALAQVRDAGVGRQVLDALLGAARARGDRQAVLDAQLGAERFYARAGFERAGEPFDEVGIPHVTMRRAL